MEAKTKDLMVFVETNEEKKNQFIPIKISYGPGYDPS